MGAQKYKYIAAPTGELAAAIYDSVINEMEPIESTNLQIIGQLMEPLIII